MGLAGPRKPPLFFVVESKKVLLFEFVGSNYLFALNLKLF